MRKEFKVILEDADKVALSTDNLVVLLTSGLYLADRVSVSVQDVKDKETDNGKTTDEEVYQHLMKQIKDATDANMADTWASALGRFCDAVRTKSGG